MLRTMQPRVSVSILSNVLNCNIVGEALSCVRVQSSQMVRRTPHEHLLQVAVDPEHRVAEHLVML